jgi:SAM-dependent methyltransferase
MTITENPQPPHYEFSEKYDPAHARAYFEKLDGGFSNRLSTWREIGMARRALALAGHPAAVLDLPCGTGRFWSLLAEEPQRKIFAADNSQSMIDTGLALRPPEVTARIASTYQCSAFATGLPDDFVESVFSIRLLHHIDKSADRVLMLKEFGRISRDTVIVSLWVDGNLGAWQRARLERRRATRGYRGPNNRFIITRSQIECEFAAAGLSIIGHVDFLKYLNKKRIYILRVQKTSSRIDDTSNARLPRRDMADGTAA